jgi:hypothetical protein
VDPVHERRVVPHLRRKWTEQVADSLLVLNVQVEVADEDQAAA